MTDERTAPSHQLSPKALALLQKIEGLEMNEWIGGGKPRSVAEEAVHTLQALVRLDPGWSVLDYGCGLGRVAVPMSEILETGRYVGADILPPLIDFCKRELEPELPNAQFQLIDAENQLYEEHKKYEHELPSTKPEAFFAEHESAFDLIFGFSLFTHFDPKMMAHLLRLMHQGLKNDGILVFTAFLHTSRNPSPFRLGKDEVYKDAMPGQPLLHALYRFDTLMDQLLGADFRPLKIALGPWRSDVGIPEQVREGVHHQDIIVAQRLAEVPHDFDEDVYMELNPDLVEAGVDAREHYRLHGRHEGRRFRRR